MKLVKLRRIKHTLESLSDEYPIECSQELQVSDTEKVRVKLQKDSVTMNPMIIISRSRKREGEMFYKEDTHNVIKFPAEKIEEFISLIDVIDSECIKKKY